MSKADEELKNRQAMEERAARRHSLEAEARPDAMHRAVHFLLHQAIMNNNDIGPEARHHLATLDSEMANAQKLAEIGEENKPADSPAADHSPASPPIPPRQSRRFSGNRG